MTIDQRKQAREKLKATYGAKLTREIAQRTGLSKAYVREWFNNGTPQPIIELKVLEMLRELNGNHQEIKQLLK